MRCLAVITVRNECAFFLEWLAHHQTVGFTDFLVFSNDCDDGTNNLLDRLQEQGEITHIRNTKTDKGSVQWGALKQADKHPLVKKADWILPLDVDEFVNIKTGQGTLNDLFAALPDATAIPLTWRLFGNAGVVGYVDLPITQQFTSAAPIPCTWPWKTAMFKTLYRNDGTYGKLGIHRPRQPNSEKVGEAQWFDGAGRKLPTAFHTQKIFSNYTQDNCSLVQLNHYPLGAMESYVLKRDRGRAVHQEDVLGMEYWIERNFNQAEDKTIQSLWPRVAKRLETLMQDEEIAGLHAAGCKWRKGQFQDLMMLEPFRQLFGVLQMTPPSRVLTEDEAQVMMRYGRKAMALKNKRK